MTTNTDLAQLFNGRKMALAVHEHSLLAANYSRLGRSEIFSCESGRITTAFHRHINELDKRVEIAGPPNL